MLSRIYLFFILAVMDFVTLSERKMFLKNGQNRYTHTVYRQHWLKQLAISYRKQPANPV